jgi:hypothetical protein
MKTSASVAAGLLVAALTVSTSLAQRTPPVRTTPTPKATPTPTPAPDQGLSGVFKFAQVKQDSAWGKTFLVVLGTPAMGGNATDMIVPNKDVSSAKLNPNDQMADLLKNAKQGDYLDVTADKFQGRWMLRSLKTYDLKPGEDEQNVFIFASKTDQKVGQETFSAINVTKFGQQYKMLVPNKKNTDGKVGPSEDMVKAIDAFTSGDAVEILGDKVGANLMIRSIKLYELPKKYIFSKIAKQKVDDKELTGVEVKDGETPVVLLVNPKDANASTLLRKLLDFKADQPVIIRSTKDGWIVDIKAGPKDAPKPTDAPK